MKRIFTFFIVSCGLFAFVNAQTALDPNQASLQQLAGLVDKSLLSYDPDSGRLEIHELLRQYAQEKLEKKTENYLTALEDHAAFYAEFMQQGWERLRSKEQHLALGELEADIENVRSAWRYYLDQKNIPKLWKFVHGIWYLYWIRWWNHAGMEFFAHTAQVLKGEVDEEAQVLRALAQAYQSYFMSWLGLADQGYEIAKESAETLQELNHPGALVFAHNSFCINAYFLAKYAEEFEALRQMVEIAAGLEDKWLTAFMLFGLGLGNIIKGEYSKAKEHAEEQLKLYEEFGDEIGTSTPLIVLGHVALGQGEYEEARGHYLRCLNIAQKYNFYYSMQTATKYLGKVSLSLDKLADAEKYLSQSLRITHEIGFIRDIVNLVYEFSRLYYARGNSERATQLLTLVVDHPASKTYRMLEGHIIDSALDLYKELESGIPPEDFQRNLQIGREMDLDQVVSDLLSSGYKGKSG